MLPHTLHPTSKSPRQNRGRSTISPTLGKTNHSPHRIFNSRPSSPPNVASVQPFSSNEWRGSDIEDDDDAHLLGTGLAATYSSLPGRKTISPLPPKDSSPSRVTYSTLTTFTHRHNDTVDEEDDDDLPPPAFSTPTRSTTPFPIPTKKKPFPASLTMTTKDGELNEEGLEVAGMILDYAKKDGWKNSLNRNKKTKWFKHFCENVWFESPFGMFQK